MSHNLIEINGQTAMAYAGETPWHGLGVQVPSGVTTDQMLKAANLDWKVEKHSLFFKGKNQKQHPVGRKHVALVRDIDNHVMDIVSSDWEPVQNVVAFNFFREFVEAGKMEMHTAGMVSNGQIVWALAKLSKSFAAGKVADDQIDNHLLFTNPHKYGKCVDIRYTPIRVVCRNTMTLALQGKSDLMIRLNHSRAFDAEQVKQTLKLADDKIEKYHEAVDFLASKRYNQDSLVEYFTKVFPHSNSEKEISKPAETALAVIDTQPGAEHALGTWWNALNAVTYATDHLLGRSDDTRLASAWYGVNRQKKINALNLAVEYAEAS